MIRDVLQTLRPVTYLTPTRIVLEPDANVRDVKVGDALRIYSNVEGDAWKISSLRVETF